MNRNDFLEQYVTISLAVFKYMKNYFEKNHSDTYMKSEYGHQAFIDGFSMYNGVDVYIIIDLNKSKTTNFSEILVRKKHTISWKELDVYIKNMDKVQINP